MTLSPVTGANAARLGVAAVGVACAISVWSIAHGSGTFTTYAGRSQLAATLFVVAGLGLIAAGLITSRRRRVVGGLAVVAGLVWFAPAWEGWERGPALPRAAAALAAPLVLPVLVHLVLVAVMPALSRSALVVIIATYALVGVPAVLVALVHDPYLDPHCFADCTTRLFVVSARPQLASTLTTVGLWLTALISTVFVVICVSSCWRQSAAQRRRQGVVVLGGVLLGLTTTTTAMLTIHQGFEDPTASRFKLAFASRCVASLLIATGLVHADFYALRIRRAVTRTVVVDPTLVESLESALATATRDPSLKVAYWLPAVGHYSDTQGRPVPAPTSNTSTISTTVVRNDAPVAVISHRSDPFELERALGPDLRLALDNERLRAEVLAQMSELRASRARIVATGDERRRQLEGNLHDGAQQSLLGLTYDLRRARADAATKGDDDLVALCDHALNEVTEAFAELRQLAHGIFPALLSNAGLGPALTSFAETAPIPVDVDCTVTDRLPATVETAVYVVVTDGIDAMSHSGATTVTITITQRQHIVVVDVTPDQLHNLPEIIHIADRVGAADGTLTVGPEGLRAEIPCRVVIADDVMLVREGIAHVLREAGVDVIAQTSDATALMGEVVSRQPDIAIVDIRMPPTHTDEGLVAATRIRAEHRHIGVLVLSQYVESSYAMRLIQDQPERVGYILKERVFDGAILLDALRRIDDGDTVIDPTIVSRMIGRQRRQGPLALLTTREQEVLSLVAEGLTNRAIATRMILSERTVEAHVTQIFQKLRLNDSTDQHRRVLAVLTFLRA